MNAEFLIDNGVLLGYAGDASDTVTVPDGVTVIGSHGFAGCSAKRIILPDTLTAIDEYAFIKCGCLTEIRLPDSLRQIGAGAFRECDSLERVTLPPRLTELPDACFYQCLSLKELHMPDSLRRIGVRALADCSALEHLTLPRGVEEIDEYAFEYCTRLRSIALPDGLRTIARHAFYCCHELSDITIPESVTAIGCSAFYQTAYQEQAKEFLISESGILISCSSDRETVDIPEGVKVIGEMAFAYNQTARRVLLPEGVTEICSRAFEQCTALEETALPESLRHIGELAFRGCNALTLPKLPDGLEVIDRGAFDCDRLAGGDTFSAGKFFLYCGKTGSSCRLPDETRVIAGGAFYGRDDLETADLNNTEIICEQAFSWCSGLRDITISDRVRYIGRQAFSSCEKLSVRLERARRQMGESAFVYGQKITFADGGRSFYVTLLNDLTSGSPEHALMGFAAEPSESRFLQLHYAEYLIPAAVCYAGCGRAYDEYLKKNIVAAVCYSVDLRDSGLTRRILDLKLLSERQAAECAAYAIEQQAFEQQLLIMRSKQDIFGSVSQKELDDRFDW